ncbi:MAG: UDP-N-acetylmuramoyl-L-alanyl-D-glutamate--2,6-diaminopimelate ligase [Bacteroidales bacterium]|nr:UDP-N-acetylmuramoyl-L-alanyl-D-glutamate--2,6-diaminopimelate ligase [Bacteroidales bacterium]MCL2133230.1 UDP-N-acetylmuramoyl-L-alanyl-D-glutamate--2,6-diaminopimelate ligase [Bacteroidales bacterium]MCL2133584.1 UDP-N-acetylmuramoyl-L-alanyl-D-glutamate--2,6-diaminopimelate ligase [Bacteroidales bacterium]
MNLTQLISAINPLQVVGTTDRNIRILGFDSRCIEQGQLFFALQGEAADGHNFIEEAVAKGAIAIVCERLPKNQNPAATYIQVPDSHEAMGLMAAEFYGHPSKHLKLIGVTGTNGKTTTVTSLYRLFRLLGYKVGLLSTVINYIDDKEIKAERTTPDAIQIQSLMADMLADGCSYAFMEVSSHSIVQRRIVGLHFDGAIFSNITHEHLDYHKTFDAYIAAKKMFFDNLPASAFALVNIDDRNGKVMVQNTKATVKTYALQTMADFNCRIVEDTFEGMHLNLCGKELWTRFIGRFNAYNILAAYAASQLLGVDANEAMRLLSAMEPVVGRFEYVRGKNAVTAVVDYAHTPDALQNVIETINDIRHDNQRLITVVGCGGNRDKVKRPLMARIAVNGSDMAILTEDNPRFEDPEAILDDMFAGLNPAQQDKCLRIRNRREAIKTAVRLANSGDIILIAGKGHENYHEVKGVQTHFDDKETVNEFLNRS